MVKCGVATPHWTSALANHCRWISRTVQIRAPGRLSAKITYRTIKFGFTGGVILRGISATLRRPAVAVNGLDLELECPSAFPKCDATLGCNRSVATSQSCPFWLRDARTSSRPMLSHCSEAITAGRFRMQSKLGLQRELFTFYNPLTSCDPEHDGDTERRLGASTAFSRYVGRATYLLP